MKSKKRKSDWFVHPKIVPPFIRQFQKELEKRIGKPCKTFFTLCYACAVWISFLQIAEFFSDVEIADKRRKK